MTPRFRRTCAWLIIAALAVLVWPITVTGLALYVIVGGGMWACKELGWCK